MDTIIWKGTRVGSVSAQADRYVDRFEGLAPVAWKGAAAGRVWMSIVFEQEFPPDE
jgi:hypothetical protein